MPWGWEEKLIDSALQNTPIASCLTKTQILQEGLMYIHVNIKRGQCIENLKNNQQGTLYCICRFNWTNNKKKRLPILPKWKHERGFGRLFERLKWNVSYLNTVSVREPSEQIIFITLGNECHVSQEAKQSGKKEIIFFCAFPIIIQNTEKSLIMTADGRGKKNPWLTMTYYFSDFRGQSQAGSFKVKTYWWKLRFERHAL